MPRSRSLATASVLLIALAPAGCSRSEPPPINVPPTEIRIELTATGINVPASVTIERGAPFFWASDYPFAVAVERNAELFGSQLPDAALRGRANAPVHVRAGPHAAIGSYKYSVAVWDGTDVRVLDPEILITPRQF